MEYSFQDLIRIALSGYDLYVPGELSRMNIDKRSEQIAFKSWYWENLEKYTSFLLLYKNIKDIKNITYIT